MKKIAILGLGFLFLLTACSKDNQNAKKLDGSWNIISLKINSIETITTNSKMETSFSGIENNKGRYNTKVFLFGILTDEVNGSFQIGENGTKITLQEDGSSDPGTGTIEELTSTFLHLTYIDDNDDTVIFRAEKK